ncbi:cysteine-rich venom protein 6-like [Argiope bruennichi]|uniref:Chymotrypsin inhibitor Ani s 6 like protein n=1 Tax=Argiope bruennichi TaxID=94029 RepID=A0A8T0DYL5_ARGBR|nr:cysteine-rich venom protein 6-like [Argiope bruennichi]KAF8763263.1 Chymotrypsin inhibitor Ani s 6 like protein [Argiope bruennichi]
MRIFLVFCVVALALFETIDACDDNQFENDCGSACPTNCQSLNDPPAGCAGVCVRRCDCKDGYIFLKGASGKCVKPDQCP